MKKFISLLATITLSYAVLAQAPGGSPAKSRSAGMTAIANSGHAFGKIEDPDGKPVVGASVIVLKNQVDTITKKKKEILLRGIISKNNGEFSFEDMPMFVPLKLKISATGFAPFEQSFNIMVKRP